MAETAPGAARELHVALELLRELRHWYFRSFDVLIWSFMTLLWVHVRFDFSNDSCRIPRSYMKWWNILPVTFVSGSVPNQASASFANLSYHASRPNSSSIPYSNAW